MSTPPAPTCSKASPPRRSIRACSTRARRRFSATKTPFYGWHYPPFFLFVAAALALLPYLLALLVWQGVTLALYLLAIRAIVALFIPPPQGEGGARARRVGSSPTPPPDRLRAATSPLRGRDMAPPRPRLPGRVRQSRPRPQRLPHRCADRLRAAATRPPAGPRRHPVRPARLQAAVRPDDPAGAGRNRALAHRVRGRRDRRCCSRSPRRSSFGMETWRAFFTFAEYTRAIVLETGETGWHKIQSVFSWVRMWGGTGAARLRGAGRGHARHRGRAGLAVALARKLRAEGRRALPRHAPRDALQPRLRPDGAGARDRVPRRRRARAAASAHGRRPRSPSSGSCR